MTRSPFDRRSPVSTDGGEPPEDEKTAGGSYSVDLDDRPSETAIRAVAVYTDRDPLTLDPLADEIDPDALDALFSRDPPSSAAVTFSFGGCAVTVEPGQVHVRRHADDPHDVGEE